MTARTWRDAPSPVARALLACLLWSGVATVEAQGVDPAECANVRLSDIGWTDVTSTTALFASVLESLGYRPQIIVLSVPVTFASMRNKDIDVFLGNWMPSQDNDIKPFLADGTVEVVRANLEGAKYTLAVPDYTYAAGLHDFADIHRFANELHSSIVGIEPGNDGNRNILSILKQNAFGLGGFKLIESSEQGMLAEVERAVRDHAPIVFLAWDPHPMNVRFKLRYLSGGDATFGPNYGGATIYTTVRTGYLRECPNIGRLLHNLVFTTELESEVMGAILEGKQTPAAAASAWITSHPSVVATWLEGVTTFDGRPAASAMLGASRTEQRSFERFVTARKIPLGDAVTVAIEYVKTHGRGIFDAISTLVRGSVNGVTALLAAIPSGVLIAGLAAFAWWLRRSWGLALFVALALLFIMNQGYWDATLETLSLVLVSTLAATLIGVPVGIAAAHRPRL
jgi:glycine betaine/proline transport system substrate-binding protein